MEISSVCKHSVKSGWQMSLHGGTVYLLMNKQEKNHVESEDSVQKLFSKSLLLFNDG